VQLAIDANREFLQDLPINSCDDVQHSNLCAYPEAKSLCCRTCGVIEQSSGLEQVEARKHSQGADQTHLNTPHYSVTKWTGSGGGHFSTVHPLANTDGTPRFICGIKMCQESRFPHPFVESIEFFYCPDSAANTADLGNQPPLNPGVLGGNPRWDGYLCEQTEAKHDLQRLVAHAANPAEAAGYGALWGLGQPNLNTAAKARGYLLATALNSFISVGKGWRDKSCNTGGDKAGFPRGLQCSTFVTTRDDPIVGALAYGWGWVDSLQFHTRSGRESIPVGSTTAQKNPHQSLTIFELWPRLDRGTRSSQHRRRWH
jgi:hypothetical protein